MSAHKAPFDLYTDFLNKKDPGDAGTVLVDRNPCFVGFVSAGAETRTLARPTKVGVLVTLHMKTDGGDITLTVTGGYNEDADTSFTFDDAGEFITLVSCEAGGTYYWRKIADHATAILTQTEAGYLEDVTAGTGAASKAVVLDSTGSVTFPSGATAEVAFNGNTLSTEAGAGITGGTGTVYKSSVMKVGGIIHTRIMIDLTGLQTSTTDLDIIGQGASVAHLGQITAARNGTILFGKMTCLEAPATGADDIDLYAADESTGVFDAGIGTLVETALLTAGAAWTADIAATTGHKPLTAVPAANQYLYLTNGEAGTVGTYTAGQFLIELWGYDA